MHFILTVTDQNIEQEHIITRSCMYKMSINQVYS
jgi:hypothetical protein